MTPSTATDCRVYDSAGNLEGLTWVPGLLAFASGGNVRVGQQLNFQGAIFQGRNLGTLDDTEQNNSTFRGSIIARRISLANSTVNHYLPIGP